MCIRDRYQRRVHGVGKYTAKVTGIDNSNYKLPVTGLEKEYEITAKEINGTISLNTNERPKVGDKLEVQFTADDSTTTVKYKWHYSGSDEVLGEGNEYIVKDNDLGKEIYAVAEAEDNNHKGSVTSEKLQKVFTVTKAGIEHTVEERDGKEIGIILKLPANSTEIPNTVPGSNGKEVPVEIIGGGNKAIIEARDEDRVIELPNTVKEIKENAFPQDNKLVVKITTNVERIEDGAFKGTAKMFITSENKEDMGRVSGKIKEGGDWEGATEALKLGILKDNETRVEVQGTFDEVLKGITNPTSEYIYYLEVTKTDEIKAGELEGYEQLDDQQYEIRILRQEIGNKKGVEYIKWSSEDGIKVKLSEIKDVESNKAKVFHLSLIHICRCRRIERCRSRWSPYH
eukprot:TRINITY_DN643_c0_g1_i8.p1 TRINITY_DN643_c0_g1~~TRINITY_DN643_c0_g1_i8.p1  ORF type:complete len:399 (+),score=38.63 TRINITY_DN643_c0_g1_i8:1-1197(+)